MNHNDITFYCDGCKHYNTGWCGMFDETTIDNCSVIARCINLKCKSMSDAL